MTTPAEIARSLTDAQRRMVLESGPDDMTGEEGCGVDLFSGADYAVAKALERKGIGHREGPGGFRYAGLFWCNETGLQVRQILQEQLK